MSNKKKIISIISSLILSITLVFNITILINNLRENESLITNINNYENEINNNSIKKEELTNNLNTIKEENIDKIKEYDKWIKWTKEIEAKIN